MSIFIYGGKQAQHLVKRHEFEKFIESKHYI